MALIANLAAGRRVKANVVRFVMFCCLPDMQMIWSCSVANWLGSGGAIPCRISCILNRGHLSNSSPYCWDRESRVMGDTKAACLAARFAEFIVSMQCSKSCLGVL